MIDGLAVQESCQSLEKVKKDTERDYWLSAEESKDYGVVDRVIESRD